MNNIDYDSAIAEIDKAIAYLNSVKKDLIEERKRTDSVQLNFYQLEHLSRLRNFMSNDEIHDIEYQIATNQNRMNAILNDLETIYTATYER